MDAALDLRDSLGFDFWTPVSPYDMCQRLGIVVRLVEVPSLEGMYVATGLRNPTILVSSLRPLGRRAFTCAHELGHHVFGDGSTTDEVKESLRAAQRDFKEQRADSFAGHLLMPKLAVAWSFTKRGLKAEHADSSQVYKVACEFGVGYTAMVYHLGLALGLVSNAHMRGLLKVSVAQIREQMIGTGTREQLIVADAEFRAAPLDAETGSLILLPRNAIVDTGGLEFIREVAEGRLFQTTCQGIHRIAVPGASWAMLLRVSRANYTGLARYRHLEDDGHDQ